MTRRHVTLLLLNPQVYPIRTLCVSLRAPYCRRHVSCFPTRKNRAVLVRLPVGALTVIQELLIQLPGTPRKYRAVAVRLPVGDLSVSQEWMTQLLGTSSPRRRPLWTCLLFRTIRRRLRFYESRSKLDTKFLVACARNNGIELQSFNENTSFHPVAHSVDGSPDLVGAVTKCATHDNGLWWSARGLKLRDAVVLCKDGLQKIDMFLLYYRSVDMTHTML